MIVLLLFILDGEAITGAKQNGISKSSHNSTLCLKSSCKGKGRWNYNSQLLKSDFVLHPGAREEKLSLKIEKIIKFKMQFNKIDELSDKHSVFSNTSDLGDIQQIR